MKAAEAEPLPFPDSLCHRCDALPRYVRTGRSVFILCPRLAVKYPPQPVLACPGFRPRDARPDEQD
ncbi:MAG TPA: hypothetical protein VK457_02510 [Chloroflexota bacterium]|nr:hypothetical protein [Chloroflexota bacterium]